MAAEVCTEELRVDHDGALLAVDLVAAMEERLEDGRDVPASDFEGMLDYLRVVVDRCHQGKEEALLFPAMREAHLDDAEDTIERLVSEHIRMREYAARIAEEISRYSAGDDSVVLGLVQNLHAYATLLRRHIVEEDEALYPLAEQRLPALEADRLRRGYAQIERDVVGRDRHDLFRAMLERMQERYLTEEARMPRQA